MVVNRGSEKQSHFNFSFMGNQVRTETFIKVVSDILVYGGASRKINYSHQGHMEPQREIKRVGSIVSSKSCE